MDNSKPNASYVDVVPIPMCSSSETAIFAKHKIGFVHGEETSMILAITPQLHSDGACDILLICVIFATYMHVYLWKNRHADTTVIKPATSTETGGGQTHLNF